MKVRFFDPARGYKSMFKEVLDEVHRVLSAGDLILRDDVEKFEKNFAAYVGTQYAVGVASGTDALILSLKALGIRQGDEVLAPSYTFRATIEAICHVGATPVLYDLEGRWNEEGHDIKAVIPAHIAGEVRMPVFPTRGDYFIIEDAAQAVGAAPVIGNTACYSFYPAKILGCYGDGGAIATDDEELYKKLKILRNHNKGDWHDVGYNSRLDNLQAAILNIKLKYLPEYIARRAEIADRYDRELCMDVVRPVKRAVYQDYIIETEKRDQLHEFLIGCGVETLKNEYPFPDIAPKLPNALAYEAHSLRLPCNPDLKDDELEYVINCINEFFVQDVH